MRKIQHKTVAMKSVEEDSGMEIEKLLRKFYVDDNLSITAICSITGISYVTVFSWLKLCNIVHRKIDWGGE